MCVGVFNKILSLALKVSQEADQQDCGQMVPCQPEPHKHFTENFCGLLPSPHKKKARLPPWYMYVFLGITYISNPRYGAIHGIHTHTMRPIEWQVLFLFHCMQKQVRPWKHSEMYSDKQGLLVCNFSLHWTHCDRHFSNSTHALYLAQHVPCPPFLETSSRAEIVKSAYGNKRKRRKANLTSLICLCTYVG